MHTDLLNILILYLYTSFIYLQKVTNPWSCSEYRKSQSYLRRLETYIPYNHTDCADCKPSKTLYRPIDVKELRLIHGVYHMVTE